MQLTFAASPKSTLAPVMTPMRMRENRSDTLHRYNQFKAVEGSLSRKLGCDQGCEKASTAVAAPYAPPVATQDCNCRG